MLRTLTRGVLPALVAACAPALTAQLSVTTAVELALKNNPKVKVAQDDVAKATAVLQEAHSVYIPSASAGAAIGQAYGYSPYPPTLFQGSAQSVIYNSSQFAYTRSARAGLEAAQQSLADARDAVAEDVAVTYAALVKDAQREAALHEENQLAQRLVTIVQERLDAGRDTKLDLTQAKLTLAQNNLAIIHAENDTRNDESHFTAITGTPAVPLPATAVFPPIDIPADFTPGTANLSPGIIAAFDNARARQEQARGDARFLYRPVVSLIVQYSRYATFTQSFQNINQEYEFSQANPTHKSIGANSQVYGVSISIPLFDRTRQAKARETAADAAHLEHEAESLQRIAIEGQSKISNSIKELRARMEVATLDQQYSQLQLDALLVELSRPPLPGRPPLSPKDEQTSRISEREKYLTLIDTTFQMQQLEINLLRQTGKLDQWLRSSATLATP
jgi:outer membrane protein TolC